MNYLGGVVSDTADYVSLAVTDDDDVAADGNHLSRRDYAEYVARVSISQRVISWHLYRLAE